MKIESLHAVEAALLRYGLALIFLWIGAMKFTAYEAAGIRPLAENSPVMSWLLLALGVQAFSNLLGVIEIAAGVLLALRPISAIATVIGSGVAVVTLLTTLTFLFTTPGGKSRGFPRAVGSTGSVPLKGCGPAGGSRLVVEGGSLRIAETTANSSPDYLTSITSPSAFLEMAGMVPSALGNPTGINTNRRSSARGPEYCSGDPWDSAGA
jgi:reactive chlorine resistance protein C